MTDLLTFYQTDPLLGAFIIALVIWTLVWKGWALWISAQEQNKKWFIALLLLNTVGILPILYIYLFSDKSKKTKVKKEVVLEMEVNKE